MHLVTSCCAFLELRAAIIKNSHGATAPRILRSSNSPRSFYLEGWDLHKGVVDRDLVVPMAIFGGYTPAQGTPTKQNKHDWRIVWPLAGGKWADEATTGRIKKTKKNTAVHMSCTDKENSHSVRISLSTRSMYLTKYCITFIYLILASCRCCDQNLGHFSRANCNLYHLCAILSGHLSESCLLSRSRRSNRSNAKSVPNTGVDWHGRWACRNHFGGHACCFCNRPESRLLGTTHEPAACSCGRCRATE